MRKYIESILQMWFSGNFEFVPATVYISWILIFNWKVWESDRLLNFFSEFLSILQQIFVFRNPWPWSVSGNLEIYLSNWIYDFWNSGSVFSMIKQWILAVNNICTKQSPIVWYFTFDYLFSKVDRICTIAGFSIIHCDAWVYLKSHSFLCDTVQLRLSIRLLNLNIFNFYVQ